jgi:hypothetical protein
MARYKSMRHAQRFAIVDLLTANIPHNKRRDRLTLRSGSLSAWCTTSRSSRITAMRGGRVCVATTEKRVTSEEKHDPLENHFLQAQAARRSRRRRDADYRNQACARRVKPSDTSEE